MNTYPVQSLQDNATQSLIFSHRLSFSHTNNTRVGPVHTLKLIQPQSNPTITPTKMSSVHSHLCLPGFRWVSQHTGHYKNCLKTFLTQHWTPNISLHAQTWKLLRVSPFGWKASSTSPSPTCTLILHSLVSYSNGRSTATGYPPALIYPLFCTHLSCVQECVSFFTALFPKRSSRLWCKAQPSLSPPPLLDLTGHSYLFSIFPPLFSSSLPGMQGFFPEPTSRHPSQADCNFGFLLSIHLLQSCLSGVGKEEQWVMWISKVCLT